MYKFFESMLMLRYVKSPEINILLLLFGSMLLTYKDEQIVTRERGGVVIGHQISNREVLG